MTALDAVEAADMVSLRSVKTGVENTLFISTKGYGRHAPRIKIAVDPPDAFTPNSKTASMGIHDFKLIGGATLPSLVIAQAKTFIVCNREALLDYWEGRISTDDMIERLRGP